MYCLTPSAADPIYPVSFCHAHVLGELLRAERRTSDKSLHWLGQIKEEWGTGELNIYLIWSNCAHRTRMVTPTLRWLGPLGQTHALSSPLCACSGDPQLPSIRGSAWLQADVRLRLHSLAASSGSAPRSHPALKGIELLTSQKLQITHTQPLEIFIATCSGPASATTSLHNDAPPLLDQNSQIALADC